MLNKKTLTREQALQKLRHFCAYQERCHQEIKEKLFSLGVKRIDHDEIISTLIEENYLNEERFAIAFAGGKFRMKKWGRIKIEFELKQRQVSQYCIRKAIKKINDDDYCELLKKLVEERYASLKGEVKMVRRKKTFDYLFHRGFEAELINKFLT